MIDKNLYQQIVGSLLYLALRTRPDILATTIILVRFQAAPTSFCHQAAKRVLRYLKGTTRWSLRYHTEAHGSLKISAFVDADYAGDVDDRKSMSGYVVKLGNSVCSWSSKKQQNVALSTCEAEYNAMTLAAKEILWVRRVVSESGWNVHKGISIFSDNQSAITWASSEKCPSGRAKHIDVSVHFVRDLVKSSTIQVQFIESAKNDADVMTKPVGKMTLRNNLARIGLSETTVEEEC